MASVRDNLLYRLRKKGVVVITKARTVDIPYGSDPWNRIEVVRLCKEFGFAVQFILS